MLRLFAVLSCVSLVTGCSSVEAEDLDGFGVGWSSLWVHVDDDDDYHYITVTNVPGACGLLQEYYEAYDEVQELFEDADDDICEDGAEAVERMADAAGALYYDGANYLSVTVFDDEGETEPDEETYEVGDSDAGLSGSVMYIQDDMYGYLEDWDEDEDPEDGCGVDFEDAEDVDVDYWSFDEGTEFDIASLSDEASLSGQIEGDLLDDEGDDAGEIQASVSATWCEIEL